MWNLGELESEVFNYESAASLYTELLNEIKVNSEPTYTLISDKLGVKITAVSTSFVSESGCVSGNVVPLSKLQ